MKHTYLFTVKTMAYSLLLFCFSVYAQESVDESVQEELSQLSPEQQQIQYQSYVDEILGKLNPQNGVIDLPNGVAQLTVPKDFYYLGPEDAEVVLSEIWGNPVSDQLSLGMLFPAGMTPFDGAAWGVTIDYVSDGFVDDGDAENIDYEALLFDMQEQMAEANAWRAEQGYESIALIGWAQEPSYNERDKKLYWAKELQFGNSESHTLNYNIRVLGRKGYLLMNFIASMEQLPEINDRLETVLAIAEFKDGNRYSDFDPSIDEVAAYGLGALVAGKVIAKTGLIAMALLFLKKFWFIFAIALGGLYKLIMGKKKGQP